MFTVPSQLIVRSVPKCTVLGVLLGFFIKDGGHTSRRKCKLLQEYEDGSHFLIPIPLSNLRFWIGFSPSLAFFLGSFPTNLSVPLVFPSFVFSNFLVMSFFALNGVIHCILIHEVQLNSKTAMAFSDNFGNLHKICV